MGLAGFKEVRRRRYRRDNKKIPYKQVRHRHGICLLFNYLAGYHVPEHSVREVCRAAYNIQDS